MKWLKSHRQQAQSSDHELLLAFRASGELSTLATLYERHLEYTYGVCLKIMPDPHLAEDAVMEIFETLSRKLRSHHVANFKSWLHTVARNHCLEYLRKSKKFKHASFSNELMHSLEISHQEYKSEPIENLDTLQGCMEKLDQKQRTSIELFYLEGNSYDEVAQLMEEEKNRVRSYLQNGRRNLRNCINEANGK